MTAVILKKTTHQGSALTPYVWQSQSLVYETDVEQAGRRSQTTLSSYEDLPTPRSNHYQAFDFELQRHSPAKSVEGPKGPHLFRLSQEPSLDEAEEYYLTMSPMTPKHPSRPETAFKVPPVPFAHSQTIHRPISTLTEAVTRLNRHEVALWSPRQVATWMYNAGFEPAIVEKFEENDISGAILTTLKFEDLRELDIQSFGQRHKLWNEIHNLRGEVKPEPTSPTEIDCASEDDEPPRRKKSSKKKHKKPSFEDIISPLESVSIVGIEQLMPKPHKCSKGENCSRWKKQQRLIENFKNGHPVSPEGGMILIAGDPGNPFTAEAVRPFSEAQPSVVASSDVLGPGTLPAFQLDEERLANLQIRDPQDNVKQFLNFQHVDMNWSSEEPATPPFEMFPPLQPPANAAPHQNLRSLPKLAIPGQQAPPRSTSAMAFSPGPMERAEAINPALRNRSPPNVYRFGTPASDFDVPVTAVNLGPIARDASQSVPPNMNYRHTPQSGGPSLSRSQSKASRRPSFPVRLPSLDENSAVTIKPHGRANSGSNSTPFSPVSRPIERTVDDVNHAGWMKKRKTRMLRHEWHEHHFTLKGTHLAMHKDERALETLEAIDIDDYAIACSSLASGSKLNAAFKAMNIKLGKEKDDVAAFSFQLIPAAIEKGQRLKKNRESGFPGKESSKTHHFAVKSRDERIDWMRELMLAKALKQKGEGFEINVNGNMI
jgi:hypothetical protein